MRVALLWHLAKEPMWWVGMGVDVGGFGFQAWALGLGQLAFVQPLLVTSLPISLVIGHWAGSHTLKRSELGWSLIFVVSLAVFLVAGDPNGGVASRSLSAWIIPLVVFGGAAVVCVVLSRGSHPTRRSLMLGAAAGMLFGVSSPLIKTFSDLVSMHGLGFLAHWEPYVLAGVTLVAFLIMASAFQAGDLRSALPAIELGQPVVAVVIGLTLFHERLRLTNALITSAVIASLAVMVVATVSLARSAAADE